jgi:hypothetical protein
MNDLPHRRSFGGREPLRLVQPIIGPEVVVVDHYIEPEWLEFRGIRPGEYVALVRIHPLPDDQRYDGPRFDFRMERPVGPGRVYELIARYHLHLNGLLEQLLHALEAERVQRLQGVLAQGHGLPDGLLNFGLVASQAAEHLRLQLERVLDNPLQGGGQLPEAGVADPAPLPVRADEREVVRNRYRFIERQDYEYEYDENWDPDIPALEGEEGDYLPRQPINGRRRSPDLPTRGADRAARQQQRQQTRAAVDGLTFGGLGVRRDGDRSPDRGANRARQPTQNMLSRLR